MNEADAGGMIREAMLVMLRLGGPLLLVSLLVGLAVALFQAVTQINEATLAFVPKALALAIALLFLGPFMFATLSAYMRLLIDRMIVGGGT